MSQRPAFQAPIALSPFWNLVWNSGAFVVGILVTFFLAPFLIRHLGDGPYGMLALIGEITGYYGLLDLGMRTAVAYFVARGVAQNDPDSANDTIHNAFWLLAAAGGLVALVGTLVIAAAPYWFTIQGLTANEARTAIAIMTATFALSLPASVFGSVLYGLRRLDLINGLNIAVRLGSVIPIVLLLRAGGGLIEFTLLQGGIGVSRWLLEAWVVRRTGLGHRLLFPIRWNRRIVRDFMRFGAGNTVINVCQQIANQLDLVVIATFLGTGFVTVFYLARTVCSYYADLISTITQSFTVHITHLHARGEHDELLGFYLRVSRLVALVSTWLMVGIVAYGRPFLALWVGEAYVSGDTHRRADLILYLMVTGLYCRTLQSMAWQVLMGSRELTFLTRINIAEAVSNLLLSVILVRHFGLLGVAAGTAIPMWICYGVVMPLYMLRKYKIRKRDYVRAVVRPAIFTCVVFGLICFLIQTRLYPQTWLQFFASATVASLAYFACAALLELTSEEVRAVALKLPFLRRRPAIN